MSKLISAEWMKLRTTRMFYGNVLAALAVVPISVAAAIHSAGRPNGTPALHTPEGVRNVLSAASSGTLIVLILGILMVAGEFRHNTATSTFLISPHRKKVIGAKLATAALVGTGLAVAASALTLVVALPWLAAKNVEISLLSSDVTKVLLGAMAATAIYALVGVGLGSVLRNQTAAVIVALGWVIILESTVVSFLPSFGRWLPGGAASALTSTATINGGLLPMWAGAAVLAAYGLAFATAGTRFVLRKDIA